MHDEPNPERSAPFAVHAWQDSNPVPDLARIPQERWREVLAQTTSDARRQSIYTTPEGQNRAVQLWFELEIEDHDRLAAARARAHRPTALPGSTGPLPAQETSQRQVSFRLSAAEHARLREAAGYLGLRSAQLARLVTVRGVGQVLDERRR